MTSRLVGDDCGRAANAADESRAPVDPRAPAPAHRRPAATRLTPARPPPATTSSGETPRPSTASASPRRARRGPARIRRRLARSV